MSEEKNSKGLFKGLILGALAGATAGVLFAPKSGKETREDIKNKAEELQGKAKELYATAEKALKEKVAELKEAGKLVDKTVYSKLVDDVVAEVKKDGSVAKDSAKKLAAQLKSDWKKVVEVVKS
jgi:gas vesicle protein